MRHTSESWEVPREIKESVPAAEVPDSRVSPQLYIAGLLVTVSGLYAVNFDTGDTRLSWIMYLLAATGFWLSYGARARHGSVRPLHVPVAVALILIVFAGLSGDQGFRFLTPGDGDDRAKNLQMVFAWMAIAQSFLLGTDAMVLFCCVPCLTMIALASTLSPEPQIQYAFVLFIGAATFLMVHENWLRTRTAVREGRVALPSGLNLMRGQLLLTLFCVGSALIVANVIVLPVRTIGQSLLAPGALSTLAGQQSAAASTAGLEVRITENDRVELAQGPVESSDTPLLKVRSDRGLYWRGATFDVYSGHSFQKSESKTSDVRDASDPQELDRRSAITSDFSSPSDRIATSDRIASGGLRYFMPERGPLEISDDEMEGSTECRQEVTVTAGNFSQLYGAGLIVGVRGPFTKLSVSPDGALTPTALRPGKMQYQIVSRVPDDDDTHLRQSASDPEALPAAIRERCLKPPEIAPEAAARLRNLAEELTHGYTNYYDKASAIRTYIASHCRYNLQAPGAPRDRDVVEHFLFESKQGYCDSFSAAMTVLCRFAGVPARVASGFLAGDLDQDGFYIVRERHKHLWSEVFFPRVGWVAFDAVEGASDISDYSAQGRRGRHGFFGALFARGLLAPLAGLFILGILGYIVKTELWDRWRGRPGRARGVERPFTNLAVITAYQGACASLARHGVPRHPTATPDEYVEVVRNSAVHHLAPEVVEPLQHLSALCARFCYGPDIASDEDVRLARAAEAQLRRLARQWRRSDRGRRSDGT